ncbi:hypothetical protein HZC27_02065 [Candidatus Roizmanbacteria bacterium]|nr:hypothetical protein [Candidatus Roizmanbacteria bacterium]
MVNPLVIQMKFDVFCSVHDEIVGKAPSLAIARKIRRDHINDPKEIANRLTCTLAVRIFHAGTKKDAERGDSEIEGNSGIGGER